MSRLPLNVLIVALCLFWTARAQLRNVEGDLTVSVYSDEGSVTRENQYKIFGVVATNAFKIDVIAVVDATEMDHAIGYTNGSVYSILRTPTRTGRGLPRTNSVGFVESTYTPRFGRLGAKLAGLAVMPWADLAGATNAGRTIYMRDSNYFPEDQCRLTATEIMGNEFLSAQSPNKMTTPADKTKLVPMPKPFDKDGFPYWKLTRLHRKSAAGGFDVVNLIFEEQEIGDDAHGTATNTVLIRAQGSFVLKPRTNSMETVSFLPDIWEDTFQFIDLRQGLPGLGRSENTLAGGVPFTVKNRSWVVSDDLAAASYADVKAAVTWKNSRANALKYGIAGTMIVAALLPFLLRWSRRETNNKA